MNHNFEAGSITRPAHYASQGRSHHHARLAFGRLASLSGAELATRWVLAKGFRGFARRTEIICYRFVCNVSAGKPVRVRS